MKLLKKLLKGLLALMLLIVVGFGVIYLLFNKPLPEGEEGQKAEALAAKMQEAIGLEAWEHTRYVEWTFKGMHHYVWDKQRHLVQVSWGDHRVLLNPNTNEGIVYTSGQRVEAPDLVRKASQFFTNDAFWLNAPAQMAGNREVKLEAVTLENQDEALLITYLSGGDTPGDSYLWILDEGGLPKAWQLWVKIIPIGGLEFSWDEWVELPSGAMIATQKEGPISISIEDLKSYQVAEGVDLFAELE